MRSTIVFELRLEQFGQVYAMSSIKNGERTKFQFSLLVLLIGIGLILWPLLSRSEEMSWGYALMFAGCLVAIAGLLMVLVFRFRSKVLEDILSDQGILGRWVYPAEQRDQLAQESLDNLRMARVVSWILALIFVLIGGIVWWADPAHPVISLIALSSVALILLAVVHNYTGRKIRQRRTATGRVIFHRQGLLYNGQLYAWDGLWYKLEAVLADPQDPTCLLVAFKFFHGCFIRRQRGLLSIPAPQDTAEAVDKMVEVYSRPASPDWIAFIEQERPRSET